MAAFALLIPASGFAATRWLSVGTSGGVAAGADDGRRAAAAHGDRADRSTRRHSASPGRGASTSPRRTARAGATPGASDRADRSAAPNPTTGRSRGPRATRSPAAESVAVRYARRVTAEVNDRRRAAGCGPLRRDSRLAVAARKHSADMARRGYFDHNSPDGATPWDRIRAEGYDAPSAENIAAGQATPADVVAAWMKSPGHRANILDCSSHAVGVGFYRGGRYGTYWTQDFGR